MRYTDEEFTDIMNRFGDTVLRVCYVRLNSLFDAQDAFQDVFISLYRSKNKPAEEYIKPWLIKSACNRCASILRSRKHTVELTGNEQSIFHNYDDTVEKAILSLEKNQRTAIYLFYFENMSASEIAEVLNTTEGNVRVILHRARTSLKEILKEDYFE